jgi:hypothetical protein
VGEPLKRNVGCFLLMIDRTARARAAEAIRHFVAGQITNKEFLRRYPDSKDDPVIWALDDTVWCLYDDISTHRLSGEYALPKELKNDVARWLMFLYSDSRPQVTSLRRCLNAFRSAQLKRSVGLLAFGAPQKGI